MNAKVASFVDGFAPGCPEHCIGTTRHRVTSVAHGLDPDFRVVDRTALCMRKGDVDRQNKVVICWAEGLRQCGAPMPLSRLPYD